MRPLPWLYLSGDTLCAEGLPLTEIADRFGTPCYVYSAARILANVRRLREPFTGVPLKIHYAVKANPLGAILRLLVREGLGAEVVSGGELYRALRAGFPPNEILFTGVGKTREELLRALEKGIKAIVVESLAELGLLRDISREKEKMVPVALRINPALAPPTHPHLATGKKGSKFGFDREGVEEALVNIARDRGLRLVGLHLHLGSQINRLGPYLAAWEYLLELRREAERMGLVVEFLDLGGGFGISYEGERAFPVEKLAVVIRNKMPEGTELVLEPGRALVGDAGILLTKVLYTKHVHGRAYIVVDAGMNDLLRPALYGAHHRLVPVRRRTGAPVKVDVVGPICENTDVLAADRELPPLQPGDLLAILDTGAYGSSMSSQYNSRPRGAEVLVYRGKAYLVRKRETLEDLVRGEIIPEDLR